MSLTVTATGAAAAAAEQKITAGGTDRLANKETFLQLLVAQLKYQNPLDPADGVQFVSQLAQFTELEQIVGMREDLASVRKTLVPDSETAASRGTAAEAAGES